MESNPVDSCSRDFWKKKYYIDYAKNVRAVQVQFPEDCNAAIKMIVRKIFLGKELGTEMILANIVVNGTYAGVTSQKMLTSGTIGAQVLFSFDSSWDGLAKTAVFSGCVTKDVVNIEDLVTIPAEVIAEPCSTLTVGVYGVSTEGTIAIPTIWTTLGRVFEGTDPSGDETTDASLEVWAQLSAEIEQLKNGEPEDKIGGYYLPSVSQPEAAVMRISFAASKEGMPEAADQEINLPAGNDGRTPEKGVDYYTEADQAEMVSMVLAALPEWEGGSY